MGRGIDYGQFNWLGIYYHQHPAHDDDIGHPAPLRTYIGLYYVFAQFSAIVSPNINGWIISVSGNNFNHILLSAPFFLLIAMIMEMGVKRAEAVKSDKVDISSPTLS